MLIPLVRKPEPAPGYKRDDVGRWEAESQLAFSHLTLYAAGFNLHGLVVGGAMLMLPWEGGARVPPVVPLTFKINGGVGARIDVELTAPTDVAGLSGLAAPYIIIRPRLVKPFVFPGTQPRKRRGVRLLFDE